MSHVVQVGGRFILVHSHPVSLLCYISVSCVWLILYSEKQCSVLTNPSNGEVVVTTVLVGGEARYFCNDGYRLNGVSNRLCQYDENWSGSEPRCERKFNQEEIVTVTYICVHFV